MPDLCLCNDEINGPMGDGILGRHFLTSKDDESSITLGKHEVHLTKEANGTVKFNKVK